MTAEYRIESENDRRARDAGDKPRGPFFHRFPRRRQQGLWPEHALKLGPFGAGDYRTEQSRLGLAGSCIYHSQY
jgi:hypothetical protein